MKKVKKYFSKAPFSKTVVSFSYEFSSTCININKKIKKYFSRAPFSKMVVTFTFRNDSFILNQQNYRVDWRLDWQLGLKGLKNN